MSVPKFMLCTRSHIYKRCISRNGARNKWKETNIENLLRFILLPLCVVVHGVCLCVCVSMCAHVSSGHTNIHLLFYLGAMEGKRPCPIIANTESEQQQQQQTQKEQIVFVLNFYSVWNWMPIYFGVFVPMKAQRMDRFHGSISKIWFEICACAWRTTTRVAREHKKSRQQRQLCHHYRVFGEGERRTTDKLTAD